MFRYFKLGTVLIFLINTMQSPGPKPQFKYQNYFVDYFLKFKIGISEIKRLLVRVR